MTAAEVTVGIPTFNRAELLAHAIRSVLGQSFNRVRLIVSDNASTDATPEVVASFTDARIEYLRSERNVGAIANLNRLIARAGTEFLVLLPDDDVLYPDHLAACVDMLAGHGSLGLVHTGFDVLDAQARLIERVSPVRAGSPITIEPGARALDRLMVSSWPACFASVMYRTSAIMDAGGLRERDGPFGDLELWMRIAQDWDFGYVAGPLTGFRAHRGSASRAVAEPGAPGDELVLVHARMRFERRMSFLAETRLAPERVASLRSRAQLQLLVEEAGEGLATGQVAARLAALARANPRILLRVALWRLIVAQLGGRRTRSLLRRSVRARQTGD